jgi:hypothetical protein
MFDSADGLLSRAMAANYSPQVAKSRDGRTVVCFGRRVSIVDPARLQLNTRPPPVHVEQIVADRKTYAVPGTALRSALPALTRDLQIDYTALSLVGAGEDAVPLQARRLGSRLAGRRHPRQAFYANLPPRTIASASSRQQQRRVERDGRVARFSIAPAYYQTAWFLALSSASCRLSGRHPSASASSRTRSGDQRAQRRLMKAQEQERIRIAGELHDGVMQEMLAATMMLGTAKAPDRRRLDAKATHRQGPGELIQVGTDLRQLRHDLHRRCCKRQGCRRRCRLL